ncbi:MAG: recombinase family protein [Lachnospiraceae bacterium]|nr:recombinase family protein [Lachnospiraceae bacterium]
MSKQEVLPADYTICAYARLSLEDEDKSEFKVESGSITSQRRLIMDFIKRQPEFARCNVIERCDDGYSGTRFDDRPQFTDMISLAREGKINCIIVKDCSRFGRDYVELGDYLEQLFPFLGVRFISINDGYDSDRDEAGLDIAFKNLVYDLYTRDMSKKGKITRARMAKQGKYLGSQVLYGYRKSKTDKHKLEKDPETAPIVREIFDAKLAGVGVTEIARRLNDRGILCPTAYLAEEGRSYAHKGNTELMSWTGSVVNGLLQNEIYTGTMVGLKNEWNRHTGKAQKRADEGVIRVEGTHEGIVTKEEFKAVLDSISEQAAHGKCKYPMHYFCGICGRRLSRLNPKTIHCNKEYAYTKSPCEGVRLVRWEADDVVIKQLKRKLRQILRREELKLKKMKAEMPGVDQIRGAEKKLEALTAERKKLCDKMLDRSIDREVFREKKAKLDEQIVMQKRWIAGLKAAEDFAEIEERIEEMKSFLDIPDMTEELWNRFVEKVVVYPDKRLEICWNFED